MITPNICSNGQQITWQFPVKRLDSGIDPLNYTVVLQEPAGVTFLSSNFSKAGVTYAPGLINIGPLVGLEQVMVTLTYTVSNVALAVLNVVDGFKYFNFRAEVFGPDNVTTNNVLVESTLLTMCPPAGAIVDQYVDCCGVDLTLGGTKCSSCTSEYRIVTGSEVNGVIVSIDSATGKVIWRRSNPILEGSFQATLWCVNCLDGSSYQVSGPATITIAPLFDNYVTGPQGPQGSAGPQGVQGPQGNQGTQGTQGNQGFQGIAGSQGTQGNQGFQGGGGAQGAAGPQGPQGTQGNQGFQGAAGVQGAQGANGAAGTQGAQGAVVNILGSVATFGDLTTITASDGDAYLVLSNNHVWVRVSGVWQDWGAIAGPQGSVGSQGFQGTQGFQGFQGVQGSPGPQGTQGATGFQGTQGPQGVLGSQGFQGVPGAQGFQGPQGNQGTQGHQGVAGAQGDQGDQGVQGNQGFTGVQGAQGAAGPQGAAGAQGAQGSQGTQGVAGTGAAGPQGDQGAAGAQGAQGAQGANGDWSTVQAINTQNGVSYTLVLADAGKLVILNNASPITLSVPTNATVAYPIGTRIDIVQLGAGQVTIAGVVGVTVNGYPGNELLGQYATAWLRKIATDTWIIGGGNLTT